MTTHYASGACTIFSHGMCSDGGTCGKCQVAAQKEVMAEQSERVRDLEAGTRQLEERCAELKDAAAGHEERARAASAEVLKGNRIIEKLMVRLKPSNAVSRRSTHAPDHTTALVLLLITCDTSAHRSHICYHVHADPHIVPLPRNALVLHRGQMPVSCLKPTRALTNSI